MRRLWIVPALLVAVVLYAVLDGRAGLRTLLRLRSDLGASEARIQTLRDHNGSLRTERSALESDRFALEKAIREDLDLALPGEIVVRIPDARTPDAIP